MKKSLKLCGLAVSLGLGAVAGSAAFAAPANTAFKDDAFYKCVVEAYNGVATNDQDDTTSTIEVTANITDAQLALIEDIVCTNGMEGDTKIKDITGITKLTNLKTVDLSDNAITAADFSGNTGITSITINKNPLTSLILSAGTTSAAANNGTGAALTVDASKATGLKNLDVEKSVIKAPLDLSKNTALEGLEIKGTKLESLDLTKNTKLTEVQVDGRYDTVVLKIAAEWNENEKTLDISDFISPKGFIDPNYIGVGVTNYEYASGAGVITITKPESVDGYIQLGVHRIFVPITQEDEDVPDTSIGEVEEKKENPDTSEASKLILGLSILGTAMLGIAVKAIVSARAKRA